MWRIRNGLWAEMATCYSMPRSHLIEIKYAPERTTYQLRKFEALDMFQCIKKLLNSISALWFLTIAFLA